MRLSVLDLVPVRVDQSTSDALAATLRLAQTADRLGYTRYWVAEHHNMPAVAATSPPVLIALLGAHTSHLRLGSGGVMLPNHAPLAVAEQFALLEAAYPGRIDLGIGRAPGSDPVTSYMLRNFNGRDGSALQADIDNFPEYLDHVVALMSPHGARLALPQQQYLLPLWRQAILMGCPTLRLLAQRVSQHMLQMARSVETFPALNQERQSRRRPNDLLADRRVE